jgi:3',5'-nucleoside bisphosphate phosphatase
MSFIDLHTHTTFSDGTMTPKELLYYGREKKLTALAITDHDTVSGLDEGLFFANKLDILFIPGIEFSTQINGIPIHILGLNINYKNTELVKKLYEIKKNRNIRNLKIIELLSQKNISLNLNMNLYNEKTITRLHIANALVEKNYCSSAKEAFKKYLSRGSIAYAPIDSPSSADIISLIHTCAGKAFLAHPMSYGLDFDDIKTMIDKLTLQKLDGVEAIYSTHKYSTQVKLESLAKKNKLIVSGGSDFHGDNKNYIDLGVGIGRLYVPYSLLNHIL